MSVGGGRTSGLGRDPYDDWTEGPLSVLAVRDEASGVDGGVTDLLVFERVPNLGSDSVPDGVEGCVEDAAGGLGWDALDAALGKGERILVVIRAVDELGRVDRDTVVVRPLLPLGGVVLGAHGDGTSGKSKISKASFTRI